MDILVWQRFLAPAMQSRCDLDRDCHLKSEWNLNKAYVTVFWSGTSITPNSLLSILEKSVVTLKMCLTRHVSLPNLLSLHNQPRELNLLNRLYMFWKLILTQWIVCRKGTRMPLKLCHLHIYAGFKSPLFYSETLIIVQRVLSYFAV